MIATEGLDPTTDRDRGVSPKYLRVRECEGYD